MFIPPYLGGIGASSSFGTGGVGGGLPPPEREKEGWRARFGLEDPKIRALLAAQMLGAPDFKSALAAIAMGPALVSDRDEGKQREEEEREERARREEDRRVQGQLHQARLRREQADAADRRRGLIQGDLAAAKERESRKAFDSQLSAAENEGKIEPGLARLLRGMDTGEARQRLRARLFPTKMETARLEGAELEAAHRQSLIDWRQFQVAHSARPAEAKPPSERTLIKDQAQLLQQKINDLQQGGGRLYGREKREFGAKMSVLEAQRDGLMGRLQQMDAASREDSGSVTLIDKVDLSTPKPSDGDEEYLRRAAGPQAAPERIEQYIAAARSFGVLERVTELVRKGTSFQEALRIAKEERR